MSYSSKKVLLYSGSLSLVEKSGVGQAILHQKRALDKVGVPYTMDEKDEYDIVHINTIFPDSYFMSRKARRQGKKVIYYAHSTEEDFKNSFYGSNLIAPLFRRWIMRCYNTGDILITPTVYSKKLLEGYGIKKKIYPLSNGIDLAYFTKDAEARVQFRNKYGFRNDDKVIISVGHYINRKGIVDFVELAKEMPQYQFIWFGHTPLSAVPKDVRAAVTTKLPNLHFPGHATQEELKAAYSGSDLFLFLTHEETEGIVLLEALATRLQVLMRDIPIYENWFQDGKNAYKARSIPEFQGKITKILNGELPATTEAGYETVRERDIGAIGKKLVEIYETL